MDCSELKDPRIHELTNLEKLVIAGYVEDNVQDKDQDAAFNFLTLTHGHA